MYHPLSTRDYARCDTSDLYEPTVMPNDDSGRWVQSSPAEGGTTVRRTLTIALASLCLLVAGAAPASANHSWGGYHWARTANPFTVPLGQNLTSGWTAYLSTASADWSQSAVLDTSLQAGTTTGRKCRPSAGTVQVCNAAYGRNGWLGLAQIWISGSHITQGATKMNDTYFSLAQYNNSAEKLHVMCQEVGHTFGLGHQDESGISLNTCMDYYHNTSDTDTKSTHPNQHDYDELATIYSHLDSTTTLAGSSAAAPVGVAGADEDGTPHGASRARGSWYAQDLGNGRVLLTHVFWSPTGH